MDRISVTRPFLPPKEEYNELIEKIWESDWLTNNGYLVRQLQSQLREYLRVEHLLLMTNGHLALEATLSAFGLKGEVITTPFTFASTTHAIVRKGLKPIFCDVRKSDLTLDPEKLESLITENTCAILPVHVYGHPCQVDAIERIAKKYHLVTIYDAAHAFGARLRGKSLCSYGDAAMLSFHATKLFHTIEGGAVVCHSSDAEKAIDGQRNYGITDEVTVVTPGGNAKMNEFQAAMGIVNLRYIDQIIQERKMLVDTYREALANTEGICFFAPQSEEVDYNYAFLPVLIDASKFAITRDQLYEELKRAGIFSRRYFYPLTCDFDCYKGIFSQNIDVPVARNAAEHILTLPLYSGLTVSQVLFICDNIKQCSKRGNRT